MGQIKKFLDSWVGTILTAVVLTLFIRFYVAQPFVVRGASMEPNFGDGDYLIVDELSYVVGAPQRGEVVVFRYPRDPSQFFIKRIVGLPGETMKIENGNVFISKGGKAFELDESYLDSRFKKDDSTSFTLGPNEYVVLGDNRTASSDSRTWGKLPKQFLIGKVLLRLWPLDAIAVIHVAQPSQ